jgi:hypothetical protein
LDLQSKTIIFSRLLNVVILLLVIFQKITFGLENVFLALILYILLYLVESMIFYHYLDRETRKRPLSDPIFVYLYVGIKSIFFIIMLKYIS